MTDWSIESRNLAAQSANKDVIAYFGANLGVIKRALEGQGPHPSASAQGGARVVYNIPARYALSFLEAKSSDPKQGTYLNRSDTKRIVGTPLAGNTIRERIDKVLAVVSIRKGGSLTATGAYYGVMELNGTGIRYFGDICLVLKPTSINDGTLTLIRNSYDLCVAPVSDELLILPSSDQDKHAADIAEGWAGNWAGDAVNIATVKIMKHARPTDRRMTTAHVSEGVLDDEDYIEVVRDSTFTPSDIEEIRLSANDAALEARIADRVSVGNVPSSAEMLWRHRRRCVDDKAQRAGLPLHTVTTTGRARS